MPENKKTLAEELKGKSVDEIAEFCETHDMSEYDDQMPEVKMTISPDCKRQYLRPGTSKDKTLVR